MLKNNAKAIGTDLGNYIYFKVKDSAYATLAVALDDIKSLSLLPKVAYSGVYHVGVPNPYEEQSKHYYVNYQLVVQHSATIKDTKGNDLSYADKEQFINDNSDLAFCLSEAEFKELAKNLAEIKFFNEDSKMSLS